MNLEPFKIECESGMFDVGGVRIDADFAFTQKFNGAYGVGSPRVVTHIHSGRKVAIGVTSIAKARAIVAYIREHAIGDCGALDFKLDGDDMRLHFEAIGQIAQTGALESGT